MMVPFWVATMTKPVLPGRISATMSVMTEREISAETTPRIWPEASEKARAALMEARPSVERKGADRTAVSGVAAAALYQARPRGS